MFLPLSLEHVHTISDLQGAGVGVARGILAACLDRWEDVTAPARFMDFLLL